MSKSITVKMTMILVLVCLFQASFGKNMFWRRGVLIWVNGRSDAHIDESIQLMERSKRAGYNFFFMDDSKFPIISKLGQNTLNRYKKLGAKAAQLKMPIVPMAFGQLDPCRHDMVFAEAYPAKETPFRVSGTEATPFMKPIASLPNGGFENWAGQMPTGWGPGGLTGGKEVFKDVGIKKSGAASIRIEVPAGKRSCALVTSSIAVQSFRAYRLSVWVRIKDVTNPRSIGFEVRGNNMWLLNLRDRRGVTGSKKTVGGVTSYDAEWKRYSWDFNSLGANAISVRMAVSAFHPTSGTVWFDDAVIEEVGLAMTQTRSTTPVVVKSESGQTYAEGKDYSIGKEKLMIPAGSAIQDGQTLKVDWYQISQTETYTPPAAFSTPEVFDVFGNTAKLINENLCGGNVHSFLIKPSEWRIAFWDAENIAQYKNAGEYMGATANRITEKVFETTAHSLKEVFLYNDNFDPYHNARPNYPYPVNQINGGKLGSWEYLHCRTIIENWNVNNRKESLYFYAGKDPVHKAQKRPQVLAGNDAWKVEEWFDALDSFEKEYPGEDDVAIGIAFSTYQNYWQGLEILVNKCQNVGRWATNENPYEGYTWPKDCKMEVSTKRASEKPNVAAISLAVSHGKVEYRIPQNSRVRVSLTNMAGQQVRLLSSGDRAAGNHEATFDKSGIARGIYLVELRATTADGSVHKIARKAAIM